MRAFAPDASIETGTFFGVTAARMAEFTPQVYTIERDPGLYNVARLRLRSKRNVVTLRGDSAIVLPNLAAAGRINRPFIYLDAHWGAGLPLATEVDTSLRTWRDVLIVADDFLVPHDSGYGYDIYDGQALCLERLSLGAEVATAFPSLPARQETGARRGTVYLGRGRGAELVAGLIDSGRLSAAGPGSLNGRSLVDRELTQATYVRRRTLLSRVVGYPAWLAAMNAAGIAWHQRRAGAWQTPR